MSPTRILKAVLLALTLLLLWWADPIAARSSAPSAVFLWAAFLLLCITVPLYLWPSVRWLPARRSVLFLLPLFLALLGFTTRDWKAPDAAPDVWMNPPQRAALSAELKIVKEIRPGLVLADVRLTSIEHFTGRWVRIPGRRKKVRTANYIEPVTHSSFPVAVQTRKDEMPRVGCTLAVRLTPKYFPKRLEGDYLASLRYQGASSYMRLAPWLIQSKSCEVVDPKAEWKAALIELVTKEHGHPFLQEKIRFSKEAEGVALGMLTGKSGWMDRDTKSTAAGLGILHLFAASGLHLGILYAVLYWPLSKLFGPKHGLATAPPLVVAAAYVWLLDFPVSLVRAFCFVSLFALRSFVHRRIVTIDHLINTALLTALFFPDSMISLSALLSFSAVGGILFLFEPINGLFKANLKKRPVPFIIRIPSAIVHFFRQQGQISFAASLPVTPWILLFFRSYAFLSPFANMVIVPMAGILLPLLFVSVFSGFLAADTWPDRLLWFVTVNGFDLMLLVMNRFNMPAFFVRFEEIAPVAVMSFVLLVGTVIVLALYKRERISKLTALAAVLLFFSLTGPMGFLVLRAIERMVDG
ncbi:ComEC/Rec2 family competence protein [Leptonema illini]|uniref:ComEC/Rec2-related protein n=1 Tax=Leptonema illini DSM 21528 TaxID=929563 RepID=H2CJB8_9LEPT|nr:ComEC/Rec2 family competence protein [Leptonema illini]EHQ06058.1 ComEC/Rec2-related protein [Leptonema illini DSM 21528]